MYLRPLENLTCQTELLVRCNSFRFTLTSNVLQLQVRRWGQAPLLQAPLLPPQYGLQDDARAAFHGQLRPAVLIMVHLRLLESLTCQTELLVRCTSFRYTLTSNKGVSQHQVPRWGHTPLLPPPYSLQDSGRHACRVCNLRFTIDLSQ
jgi:hypothetical protein